MKLTYFNHLLKEKCLIVGRDSLCLHVSLRKMEYKISQSSWNSIMSVDSKIIEIGVDRSQHHTVWYFYLLSLRIMVSRFIISEKSYLESLDQTRIPGKYLQEYLNQTQSRLSRAPQPYPAKTVLDKNSKKTEKPPRDAAEATAPKTPHLRLVKPSP